MTQHGHNLKTLEVLRHNIARKYIYLVINSVLWPHTFRGSAHNTLCNLWLNLGIMRC